MAASGTRALLHPLVLLTITDTISRNLTRGHTVPLLGGLMGQVTREGISIEHAFDIRLEQAADSSWRVRQPFFEDRIRQQQEVHKEPTQLDFMGFWTLGSVSKGPGAELASILPELLAANENALCLSFHADVIANGTSGEHRMPFTVYEPVYAEGQKPEAITDGTTRKSTVPLPGSFSVVPWEMATGEAEMIALDFVKTGAGNATRVRTGNVQQSSEAEPDAGILVNGKLTRSAAKQESEKKPRTATSELYTPEEEEMISFLTTRANAIRTLIDRLNSIQAYLASVEQGSREPNPEFMRAIKAMLSRLPGVEAERKSSTTVNTAAPENQPVDPDIADAALIELLGSLGKNLAETRELGGKFAAVEMSKRERRGRDPFAPGGAGFPGDAMTDVMDLS